MKEITLYKVLAKGRRGLLHDEGWDLPRKSAAGRWTPGAWKELPPSTRVHIDGHGLRLTTDPSLDWCRDGTAYVVETTGPRHFNVHKTACVVRRARLLRPLTPHALERWGIVQGSHLDAKTLRAYRAAAPGSALAFLWQAYLHAYGPASSARLTDRRRRSLLRRALEEAIEAHMPFARDDLARIYNVLAGARWFPRDGAERYHALAAQHRHLGALAACETMLGRPRFVFRSAPLGVGAVFNVGRTRYRVCRFEDATGELVAEVTQGSAPVSRLRLTPAALADLATQERAREQNAKAAHRAQERLRYGEYFAREDPAADPGPYANLTPGDYQLGDLYSNRVTVQQTPQGVWQYKYEKMTFWHRLAPDDAARLHPLAWAPALDVVWKERESAARRDALARMDALRIELAAEADACDATLATARAALAPASAALLDAVRARVTAKVSDA